MTRLNKQHINWVKKNKKKFSDESNCVIAEELANKFNLYVSGMVPDEVYDLVDEIIGHSNENSYGLGYNAKPLRR